MSAATIIHRKVYFRTTAPERGILGLNRPTAPLAPGRVARVARLLALAIRFDELLRQGVVGSYAELARLGHVTRARLTQIQRLRLLAPEIQEALLFLPVVVSGRDPVTERHLRPIAALADWREQRRMWAQLQTKLGLKASTQNAHTSQTDFDRIS